MKSLILTLILAISITLSHAQKPDFYTTHWSSVYRHELKGLTTSALARVDTIYAKAKKDKNLTEFTKSLIYQSKFIQILQEKSEITIVKKFQTEIASATAAQKNILESMLARIYWEYFQNYRWKYYDRSKTSTTINTEDFTTWDADAMFSEIHKHFQNSLMDASKIQNIRLESINEILALADKSQTYRPTLYDFLAHNALDFYRRDEATITRPANAFVITGDEYFTDFPNIKLASPDTLSPEIQALKIYQDLLRFHGQRRDTTAFVDVELRRLEYLVNEGVFTDKYLLLANALEKLRYEFRKHEASALATHALAAHKSSPLKPGQTKFQYSLKDAVSLCQDAIAKFKDSDGAQRCQALMDNILLEKLSLRTERFIPSDTYARLFVEYSNIDSLYLNIYRVSNGYKDKPRSWMPDSVVDNIIRTTSPVSSWSVALKNLNDFESHSTEVVVPKLPRGLYVIAAGVSKSYFKVLDIFAHSLVSVTDLALIEHSKANTHLFQIVNRNNGRPVAGADVHLYTHEPYDDKHTIDVHLMSDKNGFVEPDRYGYIPNVSVTVTFGDDIVNMGEYHIYDRRENRGERQQKAIARPFVFTDRSIYRPGQTVYFKGILVKTENKKSSIVEGEYVEVALADVNGQEVGSLRLKTNAFGSFSGEFKLPPSGLTGEYELSVDEDSEGSRFYDDIDYFAYGRAIISVEEYKRPTFEANFKPVKETFRINDTIRVRGEAISFSGAKISKGTVKYNVRRNVRLPRTYRYALENHGSQLVAHGETLTNDKGEFEIVFEGIPDAALSPDNKPVFYYNITADVTDINGETHSAETTVKLGYHAMVATINAPAKIDVKNREASITISSENINGQFVPAKGKIEIFKLEPPSRLPARSRPWPAPDLPLLSPSEFAQYFPHDVFAEGNNPIDWKKEKLTHSFTFDTEKSKEQKFAIGNSWKAGKYRMELTSQDSLGQPVTDVHIFDLTNAADKSVPDNALFIFETDKESYQKGEVARLKVGSAAEDVTFLIEVEKDGRMTKTYVENFSGNTMEIPVMVTATRDNGFSIHCTAVVYNAFLTRSIDLTVTPPPVSRIEIETQTFKDKIQPGSKETWSFTINSDDEAVETELLASMYDASLDQFKPHEWYFNPVETYRYYNFTHISADQNFSWDPFEVRNTPYGTPVPEQYYDQFDWFGFSITNNQYIRNQYLERLYSSGVSANKPSVIKISNNRQGRKGTVYGRILSEDGVPLPGVNVIIKGTRIGTVTDVDGRYSLPAKKDDELVFSFIGLTTTQIKVGRKNTIDVLMTEDITQLQEVVVTGLGVQREKRSLAYSVASVAANDTTASDTTASDLVFHKVQGKISGVMMMKSTGSFRMEIRGNSSLHDDSKVLYVVDGVIVENYELEESELASAQVLKGSAATALYGARAANGVIIITTKSGQKKMDEELAKVNARKNFNETAFFFPHLRTDENGKVRFTFTTPESLTRWKLQLLAHRKDLRHTSKTLQAISQKQLMVTPNPPRFLRVNDEITISAKIANLSSRKLDGKIGLQLTDAISGESVDIQFGNVARNQTFRLAQKGNTEVSWKLKVPDGIDAVQYKIVAKAGNFSDGEQNILPVLPNRMLVTETMPLYVRSSQTKAFTLDKLATQNSESLKHHQLTLEITSNPAWYAIQSLPYLMEFPHECAEQLFSRFYANTLASHIANSNPDIKAVFDKWASADALISNLEKNQELKALMVEETPWLRDAQSEREQKKRIAMLFDLSTMKAQLSAAMTKLEAMQFSNGAFPWFTGCRYPNRYITQHVASGYGHLKKLNVVLSSPSSHSTMNKAVGFLDREFVNDYNELMRSAKALAADRKVNKTVENYLDEKHLTSTAIHYLYMRSFYKELDQSAELKVASQYYIGQSAKHWQKFNLYMKGMIALIQFRNGNERLAREILASLKENSITSEELGMYWKENVAGYSWDEAPIETHALLIEAFAEILPAKTEPETRNKVLDELRLWLLKNKQTSQWKTTKATTEAIYALISTGTQWLSLDNAMDVTVGQKKLDFTANKVEAGTGYSKTSWNESEIRKEMSNITISKHSEGVAWGGLYWQYFEDLDQITPAETPLKLSKKVFLVTNTDLGQLLTELQNSPVTGNRQLGGAASNSTPELKVGDLVRIRIELSSDRAMEFIHMKDMRAAGFEPVDVISEYKWQDGLGYYQSTRDAATNFFFDFLPKGVYVFEYDLRVNNAGTFSNGITTIQCMYAPEFSSHSEGVRITVE